MPPNTSAPSKDGRYWVNVPPYYYFQLKIEAFLKGRSLPQEGGSLLCSKLGEREVKRGEMLVYIARQMGISTAELERGILNDTIAPDLSMTEPADESKG